MLTEFPHIKGLSDKAKGLIPGFLQTLQSHYIYPTTVKSKNIESALGIKGTEVRSIVRYLRRQGHFITSNSNGYGYLEKTVNNANLYENLTLKHLEERISSMRKTAVHMREAIDRARDE